LVLWAPLYLDVRRRDRAREEEEAFLHRLRGEEEAGGRQRREEEEAREKAREEEESQLGREEERTRAAERERRSAALLDAVVAEGITTELLRWLPPPEDPAHPGRGVAFDLERDPAAVTRMWREAAERGDAAAQFLLGFAYVGGRGVPKNPVEAVRWLRKAAEQGHAAAQYHLACAYFAAHGVSEDRAEGTRWLRKAANRGHAAAQYALAFSYANGRGVEPDDATAADWFYRAGLTWAEQGREGLTLSCIDHIRVLETELGDHLAGALVAAVHGGASVQTRSN